MFSFLVVVLLSFVSARTRKCELFIPVYNMNCEGGVKTYFGDDMSLQECHQMCKHTATSLNSGGCCASRAKTWGGCWFFAGGRPKYVGARLADQQAVKCH